MAIPAASRDERGAVTIRRGEAARGRPGYPCAIHDLGATQWWPAPILATALSLHHRVRWPRRVPCVAPGAAHGRMTCHRVFQPVDQLTPVAQTGAAMPSTMIRTRSQRPASETPGMTKGRQCGRRPSHGFETQPSGDIIAENRGCTNRHSLRRFSTGPTLPMPSPDVKLAPGGPVGGDVIRTP